MAGVTDIPDWCGVEALGIGGYDFAGPYTPAGSGNGDQGDPAALGETPAAEQLRAIARVLAEEYVPPVEMAGCSARMLDAAMAALDALDENESSTKPADDATTESASATAAVQRSSSGGSSGRS